MIKKILERANNLEDQPKVTSNSKELGYKIGDYIVDNYLVHLSIDTSRQKNIVIVSEEDVTEYNNICNDLHESYKNSDINIESPEWTAYIDLRNKLKDKYLPEFLYCVVERVPDDIDMKEFKQGVCCSLWDCDMSSYSCNASEIVVITDNEKTVITLKRD